VPALAARLLETPAFSQRLRRGVVGLLFVWAELSLFVDLKPVRNVTLNREKTDEF
jgi:hypothetical protein